MSSNHSKTLDTFFFSQVKNWYEPRSLYWLAAAIFFGILYPCMAIAKASGAEYWIQDDARQHIFWMARFLDPALFPNDLIADYYQNISPQGVKFIYWVLAKVSFNPITVSHYIPILLGILTSFTAYLFCLEILNIPLAGFLSSIALNQNLWMQDGLSSGTAKAFLIPIFILFLWGVIRKSFVFSWLGIILLGLFYPSFVLVASGVLTLRCFQIQNKRIKINHDKSDLQLNIIGLFIAFFVLLPLALSSSEFEPVITLAQAQQLPEFEAGGRTSFFQHTVWDYVFNGSRTGIRITSALIPNIAYLTLVLPIVLVFKHKFKLSKEINNLSITFQLIISGFTLFILAHLLLFKLYLPSRYTLHTLRFAITLLSGVTFVIVIQKFFLILKNRSVVFFKVSPILVSLILGFLILVEPVIDQDFPVTGYHYGQYSQLYSFLEKTSKDTVIVSVVSEVNNIPSFTNRSVFIGEEYGIPYHTGYYNRFRQRAKDTIAAHFTTDLKELQSFIAQSSVDLWLISDDVFKAAYLKNNGWLNHFQPETNQAIATLESSNKLPALQRLETQCIVFTEKDISLIDSRCILAAEIDNS
ncbi:hypothetical protein [[Limnothrix rosea] IAM M-220]|uniref:hypothetical protein n=1 Tax=[Limnothrix rosea] IAM M-220 TaxID=454133 RepID=UPI000965471B|nr:hypothetical protein [[Limnothrix rosea] IAM M-220]OKH18327.1 hypothetical protein NIES208_06295 [[Limnothrix rosea] IAM M-220]